MVKTFKSSHLLLKLFNKLCIEKYRKTYMLIFFTKTRWGTVYYAAQRASTVKSACASLPSEILNANYDIDISDELKALVTDQSYWKGVSAMEALFKTICSCLTYLEGDKATFSAMYACFVAIKFHIKTLNSVVKDALDLTVNDIEQIVTMIHHRFSTIYTEAHALTFATDPLFTPMRIRIAAKFSQEFLQLGKFSINHQSKAAISRLANGSNDLRRKLFSEFGTFIVRPMDKDDDFSDITFKPSELWTLSDDHYYGAINGRLSALHKNPTGASGGERNHKAAKCVHNRSRARLGKHKIEIGTAILFNSEQLNRQIASTRDTKFCKWLHQLCPDSRYEFEHEMDPVDEDEDAVGGSVDEFDRVNISEGVDDMHDEDIFEAEEVMDEASRVTSTNEVDGGPLSVV